MNIIDFDYKNGTYTVLKIKRSSKKVWVTEKGDFPKKNSKFFLESHKEAKQLMCIMDNLHRLNNLLAEMGVNEVDLCAFNAHGFLENEKRIETLIQSANDLVNIMPLLNPYYSFK